MFVGGESGRAAYTITKKYTTPLGGKKDHDTFDSVVVNAAFIERKFLMKYCTGKVTVLFVSNEREGGVYRH